MRPTAEDTQYARTVLDDYTHEEWRQLVGEKRADAIRALLDATEPPTDVELLSLCARLANEEYDMPSDVNDEQFVQDAFDWREGDVDEEGDIVPTGDWQRLVRSIRTCIRHFFGPVKP